ncbi:MAG: ATP-binding cassette domain-containing protein [Crocinitomicaceae bacterium]|nr:MAG: ATP-binding cassette domain-containing protein [Crocinitomicaceae bacterium]
MDGELAIEVLNVSKVYPLRQAKIDEQGNRSHEHHALKDISFRIKKGESVGIIGHNGSGKSTLLKILAGVTKPTSGSVKIRGRVASILDIGAGFHPELSGRENVFLNGQIHGFAKKEIEAKFDEIVAFSGIEKFIEEPVKNYSNGMYLRLAFSIMVHLDFDVYLFDEVMSVGDFEFMMKSKDKIEKLHFENKTVVYVSHNFMELQNQTLFIYLENGILKDVSTKVSALDDYLEHYLESSSFKVIEKDVDLTDFPENNSATLIVNKVRFYQNGNNSIFCTSFPFTIEIEYDKLTSNDTIDVVFTVSDFQGNMILSSSPFITGDFSNETKMGKYSIQCEIPNDLFNEQIYRISIYFLKNSLSAVTNPKNSKVSSMQKLKASEVVFCLSDIIVFKPYFRKNDKHANLSSLNLKGRLLSGFKWNVS